MCNAFFFAPLSAFCVMFAVAGLAQANDPDFSGKWHLNEEQSEIHARHDAPPHIMEIKQEGSIVHCRAFKKGVDRPEEWSFSVDGKERVTKADVVRKAMTKWEGSALLVNTIVLAGNSQFTEMDRWKLSRNGKTLTIRRQVMVRGHELESNLYYERKD